MYKRQVLNIVFVVYLEQGIEGVFKANIIVSSLIFLVSLPIIIKRVVFDFFEKDIFFKVVQFALPFLACRDIYYGNGVV